MLKKLLLNFTRRYYNTDLTYADKLLLEWEKKLMQFVVSVLFNGFFFWLFLMGLRTHFPFTRPYIFIGEGWWNLLAVPTLGLIIWYLTNAYEYRHKVKKRGGK